MQAAFPLRELTVELPPSNSCVKLALHSDALEEWEETAAPLALAYVLSHVRYGYAALRFAPMHKALEAMLHMHPARLRALSAQSGGAAVVPLRSGKWLLLCGPRSALSKAGALLAAWEQSREQTAHS